MYRFYTSEEKAQAHLDAGVKRVVISALLHPGAMKNNRFTNVNDDTLDANDKIISPLVSFTTTRSCLAPMGKHN